MLALMESFLRAGVLGEAKDWRPTESGTPQGGVISPLLANLYLDPLDHQMAATGWEIGAHALHVGQGRRSRGKADHHLSDDGNRRKARRQAFAGIQSGNRCQRVPEVKTRGQGVDDELAAVGRNVLAGGEVEVKAAVFLFASRHARITHKRASEQTGQGHPADVARKSDGAVQDHLTKLP